MLGRHGLHRPALQVVALLAGGHALQVAGGARVDAQRQLERIALEPFRVRGHQVLKNTALERPEHRAKELRVQRGELLERRRNGARAARRLGARLGRRCTGLRGRRLAPGCTGTVIAAAATRALAPVAPAPALAGAAGRPGAAGGRAGIGLALALGWGWGICLCSRAGGCIAMHRSSICSCALRSRWGGLAGCAASGRRRGGGGRGSSSSGVRSSSSSSGVRSSSCGHGRACSGRRRRSVRGKVRHVVGHGGRSEGGGEKTLHHASPAPRPCAQAVRRRLHAGPQVTAPVRRRAPAPSGAPACPCRFAGA